MPPCLGLVVGANYLSVDWDTLFHDVLKDGCGDDIEHFQQLVRMYPQYRDQFIAAFLLSKPRLGLTNHLRDSEKNVNLLRKGATLFQVQNYGTPKHATVLVLDKLDSLLDTSFLSEDAPNDARNRRIGYLCFPWLYSEQLWPMLSSSFVENVKLICAATANRYGVSLQEVQGSKEDLQQYFAFHERVIESLAQSHLRSYESIFSKKLLLRQ